MAFAGIKRLLASAAAGVLVVACSRHAPDATPDGAVRAWLDRMEASDDEPQAIHEAYALLGPDARANLEERAARASRLEGHHVEPWEMLAEGRFGLKFRPKAMVAKVTGDTAVVEVTGDEPNSERALVRCARVGGWRVEPDLPPPPALAKRDPDRPPPRDDSR